MRGRQNGAALKKMCTKNTNTDINILNLYWQLIQFDSVLFVQPSSSSAGSADCTIKLRQKVEYSGSLSPEQTDQQLVVCV